MAGRPLMEDYPVWSIDPRNPERRATCAHISILIKRNPNMTLDELATELAKGKHRPVEECLEVLQGMLDRGHLGYFNSAHTFHRWVPRKEDGHVEKCKSVYGEQ